MSRIKRHPKGRPNFVLKGTLLKLREGMYRQSIDREWIFNRMENNLIYLIHRNGAYGVVVGVEEIDWNE